MNRSGLWNAVREQIGFAQGAGKLFSDAIWSLSGNILSLIAGLAVVKIVTNFVQAEEYGQASLVLGVLALLNSFLAGPLMTVHMRIYFDYLERQLGRWYREAFKRIVVLLSLFVFIIYISIASVYSLGGNALYLKFFLPIALVIALQPRFDVFKIYLESHREQRHLAFVNILHKVVYPAFLLLLLMATLSPVNALLLAHGCALCVPLLIFRAPAVPQASTRWPDDEAAERRQLTQAIRTFGWALPLGSLVMWVLTTSDRYLIAHFLSEKEVGIYAMNYGFWSLPYAMLNGWLEVLTRPLLYDRAAKEDWQGVQGILLKRSCFGFGVSLLGTVTCYLCGNFIAHIMLGGNYWVGNALMLCIAGAHCFYVLGYSILPLFLANKCSQAILLATALAAIANVIANIFFIPVYGLLGAAYGTLIAYLVWDIVLAAQAYAFFRHINIPALVSAEAAI